ncbi:hypothetical protein HXX76_001415 [Chlamydomonas incerta]|uniref:Uncharacterized protein n=1 Tax=Chlamydomonas incerta TaxID=51695 RepID=A0A835WC43_CHLIN|nr:hypothetical protein HXX76_001415 [Chlamydomonas incerta]|eukprot:KAG2444671.1 hypothetical protein HXX76_001415 [Chlamydomonas incerta]
MSPSVSWGPMPGGRNVNAFNVFRKDDAVVRALQGSQVALHEYRMAYDNLLQVATADRDDWSKQKLAFQDDLRALAIRNSEAERLFKEQLTSLQDALIRVEQAYAALDAESREKEARSEASIAELMDRALELQDAIDQLQAERLALLQHVAGLQADAALKDAAVARVAELEGAIAALRERAKYLVADLQREKDAAEARIVELAGDLSLTRQQLAEQAAARAASEDAALRLALERQRLAAALELERLINEPLRHTHYATTTTLAHVMRSTAAPTVQQRSGAPAQVHTAASPQYWAAGTSPDLLTVPRPGSAPPSATKRTAGMTAAAVGGGGVSPRPQLDTVSISRPDMSAALTGKDLTRLGRAWGTTTATAGHPHPAYPENVYSHLTPPPPGPPRRNGTAASTAAAAGLATAAPGTAASRTRATTAAAAPGYSPFYGSLAAAGPATAAAAATAATSRPPAYGTTYPAVAAAPTAAAPTAGPASAYGSYAPTAAAVSASAAAAAAAASGSAGIVPRYLTDMPRSPGPPDSASVWLTTGAWASPTAGRPNFLAAALATPAASPAPSPSPAAGASRSGTSARASPAQPSGSPAARTAAGTGAASRGGVSGGSAPAAPHPIVALRAGRPAMRSAIKAESKEGSGASTMVYG